MVLDHISNYRTYAALGPAILKALEWLVSNQPQHMENGRYDIDGDAVFAIVNSYDTKPQSEGVWEAHQEYLDVQFVASGSEKMGYAPLHTMKVSKPYDSENDYALFSGDGQWVTVPTGYFTIFYPYDVHMPGIVNHHIEPVKKVVVKVKYPEVAPQLQLVVATNNAHKMDEVRQIMNNPGLKLRSLQEAHIDADLPETGDTFSDNALEKAMYVYNMFGKSCFADDSGLEIDALDGRPGVYSARYAGAHGDHAANIQKVLTEMEGVTNRKARFKTVIALVMDATPYLFEGVVEGSIAMQPSGHGGFGYDPIFIPDGYNQTFAELPASVKNGISHRAKALEKLSQFIQTDLKL